MAIFSKFKGYLSALEDWYLNTPERSLEQSFRAALKIKQIEDEHFDGQRIEPGRGPTGSSLTYFESELNKYLKTVRMRLTEFKASNWFIDSRRVSSNQPLRRITTTREPSGDTYTLKRGQYSSEATDSSDSTPAILEKLKFIDATLQRYQPRSLNEISRELLAKTPTQDESMGLNQPSNRREISRGRKKNQEEPHSDSLYRREYISDDLTADSKLDSSSFIPRSILRTADRFRRELNSNLDTEEEVVEDFRNSRLRTRIAIRFLILLTIVPLLTQQISKHFVIGPIVDHFDRLSSATVGRVEQVINSEIETQILAELQRYEQKIRFQNLVKEAPLTAPDIEKKLKAKAIELADQFHWQLTEPLKNIISDGFGLAAFSLLVLTGQPQIGVVKSFLDEAIYGLSDSAKAFIIILFTDVFVGFHSPHGWGVVIHNTLQHFGLPQNENFIDMFIATFPVMLDTVFKYWIFRYLNQVSPSAVATYRNMNE